MRRSSTRKTSSDGGYFNYGNNKKKKSVNSNSYEATPGKRGFFQAPDLSSGQNVKNSKGKTSQNNNDGRAAGEGFYQSNNSFLL